MVVMALVVEIRNSKIAEIRFLTKRSTARGGEAFQRLAASFAAGVASAAPSAACANVPRLKGFIYAEPAA